MIFEEAVESFNLFCQFSVIPFCLLHLILGPTTSVEIVLQLIDLVLELLYLSNLTADFIFQIFLVLLKSGNLVEILLELRIPSLPLLDLSLPGLEDAINPVIFDFKVVDLALVVEEFIFKIFVFGKLSISVGNFFFPSFNLVKFGPQNTIESLKFFGCQVEFVAKFFIVMLKISLPVNFLFKSTSSSFPFISLSVFTLKSCSELFAFKLPILKLF